MANEAYKARARRLAAHLKAKFDLTISHSAALEAVAAEEGARDWNTLSAKSSTESDVHAAVLANCSHKVWGFAATDEATDASVAPADANESVRLVPVVGGGGFVKITETRDGLQLINGKHDAGMADRVKRLMRNRADGVQTTVVNRTMWDYINFEPRMKHAAWRLEQALKECIEGRRSDLARGAETGRLAATLLQKEGMGMLKGAEAVADALDIPRETWRASLVAAGRLVDEATAEFDPQWRTTMHQRWAARPADLVINEADQQKPLSDERDPVRRFSKLARGGNRTAKVLLTIEEPVEHVLEQPANGRYVRFIAGRTGEPKSLLSRLSPSELVELNAWASTQPRRDGTLDLMGWPGWAEVVAKGKPDPESGESET